MAEAPKHDLSDELTLQLGFLAAAEQRARRRARLVGAAAAALAAAFVGALVFYDPSDRPAEPGPVSGRLELQATPLGSGERWAAGGGCLSGAARRFRGVDLLSADRSLALRVVEDQLDGSWVEVQGDGRPHRLDRSSCSELAIELETIEGRSRDQVGYRGGLRLDCRLGEGRLRADLRFEACRD